MLKPKAVLALSLSALLVMPPGAFASSHREAPITALDHKADITDFYSFVSYDHPDRVTFLMNVDPFLEPSNGPNYFPFDPNILYEIKIDNDHDALADVTFQIRFSTEIRSPRSFVAFSGDGAGRVAGPNSPPPVAPGTPIVPPAITALDGPGSQGINLRQTYTVTMVKNGHSVDLGKSDGSPLFAVPSNVGPQTMPNYDALARQGIYSVQGKNAAAINVFAGTVADPFFIDLGAAFDTFNFRLGAGGGILTPNNDLQDKNNTAPNAVSGFNVNTIALEVPSTMLTSDGAAHPASDPRAVIGSWATTSRRQMTIRRTQVSGGQYGNSTDNNDRDSSDRDRGSSNRDRDSSDKDRDSSDHNGGSSSTPGSGAYYQVQRFGNPLVNELIIGTGSKDRWSMEEPVNDFQFLDFDLDPTISRVFNALFLINIPPPPRLDLLPLVTYAAPIAPRGTPAGPIADLMRLNTGVPPTPFATRRRLGLLAGDPAGFPNGRRLTDDVVDIIARVVGAGVLNPKFNLPPNNLLGDGVNATDVPPQESFPYAHFAYSGRDSRHIDPGEIGCGTQPSVSTNGLGAPFDQGGATPCPVQ